MRFFQKSNIAEPNNIVSLSEFNWDAIIIIYCVYFGIYFIGAVAKIQINYIGAAFLLCLLCVKYWRQLFEIKDVGLTICIVILLILSVVPMVFYDEKTYIETFQEVIKYYALNYVILIGVSLPLTPLWRAKKRRLLYGSILLFLLVGWVWPGDQGLYLTRVKGFLPNPNNFALTVIMLFCLIDDNNSHPLVKWTNHFIILSLIYVSKTSGAFLGYMFGMSYRIILSNKSQISIIKMTMLSVLYFALIILFLLIPSGTLKPIDNTITKINVAFDNIENVLSGKEIDYTSIGMKTGQTDAASGAWRFYHWRRILSTFANSPIYKQLFGYGIGTSDIHFGTKPHNDYFRILYETGIIGFLLNLFIWLTIYRRMDIKYRWLPIIVAVYSITENNYDHFPAMSLLVFYMLSANKFHAPVLSSSMAGENGNVYHVS